MRLPFVFVPLGTPAPPEALVLDGAVPSARATYSHWRGADPTPPPLRADTSTEIACRAAADPARWLSGFSCACNNHVDADGLLSAIAACRPQLALAHRDLLIRAAEAGDFSLWTGADAFRLMLRLHQHIAAYAPRGPGFEQSCYDAAIDDAESLIAAVAAPDAVRDGEVLAVERLIARLAHVHAGARDADGLAVSRLGQLAVVRWRERLGHPLDRFTAVAVPDDLPVWALSTVIPAHCFQLLASETDDGFRYVLDAPRHSWAVTVDRPTIAWPDLARLCDAVQAGETGRAAWCVQPAAARYGFVCLLASGSSAGDQLATSQWQPEALAAQCAAALLAPQRATPLAR